jgi:DNA-binding CsgD family transcriptional regulator
MISDLVDLKTIESDRANQVLDALSVGVVMTDTRGGILHANSAADAMMQAGKPIRSSGGAIEANVPSATEELHAAIALAAGREAALGGTGLGVRLTSGGEPPVVAHVLPLKQGEARSRLKPKAAAAVFVGAVSGGANGAEALSVAYGLTRMETRVLAALLAGQRLAQVAETLGIAHTTARTHLNSIFAKTGVSRQAELVRVAMQAAR